MPDSHLFYIHDPMCSWCYAFDDCLTRLEKDLPSTVQLTHLLGGLAPDSTTPMAESLRKTIQQAWRQIEKTVPGIQFNHDFWVLNTPFRSTYPACRAILAARKQGAGFELKIRHAMQTAYYQKAKNPSLQATLRECADEVGLDIVAFMKDLNSSAIDDELQHEINRARKMGVCSYPSLRLLHHEKYFPIAVDYLEHHKILNEINGVLKTNSS